MTRKQNWSGFANSFPAGIDGDPDRPYNMTMEISEIKVRFEQLRIKSSDLRGYL